MTAEESKPGTRSSTKIPLVDCRTPQKDRKDYSGFVEVLVGKDDKQQKFHIHEQLLTSRSLFFKKAMSGNWSEAKERIVRLPEDPPTIFHIYVDLLYTNQITVISNSASRVPTLVYDEQNTLARLYVLVEKLQDLDAKNKTLTAMVASLCETYSDGHKYAIGHAAVHIVYEGTPSGSLLRKLIVDTYTSQATRSWVSEAQKLPDDFVRELLISVVAKRSGVPGLVDINDLTAYMELTDTKSS